MWESVERLRKGDAVLRKKRNFNARLPNLFKRNAKGNETYVERKMIILKMYTLVYNASYERLVTEKDEERLILIDHNFTDKHTFSNCG